ncbi:hypothetical protein HUU42_14905 [bacterium]|nr:hypothetical protein [bacterium]
MKNSEEHKDPLAELTEAEAKWSKSDSQFLKDLLTTFYRQTLPFDIQVYKTFNEQPPDVRMAIQNDAFWSKVGKYIEVLDFSEVERERFAHESESEKLALFLLFEKNPMVLEAVFNNPRLPTKILFDYINLIKERDIDREDDKILKQAQSVMKKRSRRIIKARDIQAITREAITEGTLVTLFTYLADDDSQIVAAASNAVSSVPSAFLKKMLDDDEIVDKIRGRLPQATGIDVFNILHAAVRMVLKALESNQMLGTAERTDPTGAGIGLRNSLRNRKLRELERSVQDPSDFFNLSVLAFMHLEPDKEISTRAAEILQLDDIFELVSDESTPRRIVDSVLRLMEKHPDEGIQGRVKEVRFKEAERLNKKMKEIEISVNAYFDVIFQSLGYSRINDQKDAIQVLKTALNYLQQFRAENAKVEPESDQTAQAHINRAIQHFQGSISNLYLDTKKEVFEELDQIQGMIKHILDLKNFKFDDESHESEEPIDESVLNKAVMIWRAAMSQYLGRIKDLEEMLHLKWAKLVQEVEPSKKQEAHEDELHEAFSEIEKSHKDMIECKLKIPCRECKRRGCASERFMLQVDFLLDEINDNFSKLKQANHHA